MGSGEEANRELAAAEELLQLRRLEEAIESFDRAEQSGALKSRCSGGRWLAHMLRGSFRDAWRESDALRMSGDEDVHRFWDGRAVAGKRIIVRCLHGFGDSVQFLQYVPKLLEVSETLIVEVHPRFVQLAQMLCAGAQVRAWDDPSAEPPWDVQLEVTELPYMFRTEPTDLPIRTKYLQMPERPGWMKASVEEGDRRWRVGLAWQAGAWNPSRSLPAELLSELLQGEAVFYNLQPAETRSDAVKGAVRELRDVSNELASPERLAEFLRTLDLVITVDTLSAHLAGAMGVRCWLLLQYAADWRWMVSRSDSPWYPTLRLFRQPVQGDWRSVVRDVRLALEEKLEGANA